MAPSPPLWFRRRRRVVAGRLESELAAETTIRPAESASYRGSTFAEHPTISNDGLIALTRSRLFFRTLTGKAIDIPMADITGVHAPEVVEKGTASGQQHLAIETGYGEVGFLVDDAAAWVASLVTVADRPLSNAGSTRPFPGVQVSDASGLVRKRGSKKTIAVVFTSIGVAFGLAAGISAAVVAESISGNLHTSGTVVDISEEDRGYAPIVEFAPPGEPPVRFTERGSALPAFDVGERVEVRYDPDDPRDAGIDRFWEMWIGPTLFALFAAIFLPSGIAFGVLAREARRRSRP